LIFDSITFPEEYVEGLDGILGEYEFFNIKIKVSMSSIQWCQKYLSEIKLY